MRLSKKSNQVRKIRKALGLTQKQVARGAGISVETLSDLENEGLCRSSVHIRVLRFLGTRCIDIAGFKLVPKRASLSYADEAVVRARIHKTRKIKHEDAYTESLLPPPQLKRMCKRLGLDFEKRFGDQVREISSSTTGADALNALLERD